MTAEETVARASFAYWAEHNERKVTFEDMNPHELEFALAHATACIQAFKDWQRDRE